VLGLNLIVEIPPYRLLNSLSRRSSIFSPLGVFDSVLGVSEGLINLPVIGDVHRFFFSFKDKKFNLEVFLEIPKVFQEDVPLSGILLVSPISVSLGIDVDTQLLALVNFRIPISSLRSLSFGIILYTEINSTTSPAVGALINPSVF